MLKSGMAVVVFSVVLMCPPAARADFPVGTWKINGNGEKGDLVIKRIDEHGNVTGTIYGDKIAGVYDAKTKCLSFLRTYETGSQAWKGYVFDKQEDGHYTIAGTFQSFAFGQATKRVDAGWYGKIPESEK